MPYPDYHARLDLAIYSVLPLNSHIVILSSISTAYLIIHVVAKRRPTKTRAKRYLYPDIYPVSYISRLASNPVDYVYIAHIHIAS